MKRWCLLVAVVFAAATGSVLHCDQITGNYTLMDTDWSGKCKTPRGNYLGNPQYHAVLDFSKASETTINTFLGQKTLGEAPVATIFGSVIMAENSKVEWMNLGKITVISGFLVPSHETFIEIRDNLNLKNITGAELTIKARDRGGYGDGLKISVYNNPQLDEKSLEYLKKSIHMESIEHGIVEIYLQKAHECRFQDPWQPSIYSPPLSDKFLEQCKMIVGDFIMESGRINHEIGFSHEHPGCLRLIDVNMTGFLLKQEPLKGAGKLKCGNGKVSEIRGNIKLCGEQFHAFINYFQHDLSIKIELHEESCVIVCTNQQDADSRYNQCSRITFPASLNEWYGKSIQRSKENYLLTATASLSIIGTTGAIHISLVNLTQADELIIEKNNLLETISLPKLHTIKKISIRNNELLTKITMENLISIEVLELVDNTRLEEIIVNNRSQHLKRLEIIGNNLTFEQIQSLPFTIPVDYQSNVLCNISDGIIFTNFEEIALCTDIHGQLTLKGKQIEKSNASLFQVKNLYGCLTVEDTDLWDLEFLTHRKHKSSINQRTKIHCTGRANIFKNNPYLCPIRYEDNSGLTNITRFGTHAADCDQMYCGPEITEGCRGFYGDLIIDDNSKIAYLKTIIGIRGQLIIRNTAIKELDFPSLQFIGSIKTPILTVVNNPKLKSLRMPNIKDFIARKDGQPLIYLENNPQLANLSQFLPSGIKCQNATNATNATCYHDGIFPVAEIEDDSWKPWQLALMAIGPLVALLLAGGCLVVCLRRREKRKHNLLYIHFKSYRGYELVPLIYERVPFIKKDLKPLLNQIICNGLMRYNLINWRQKFLEQRTERMDYFAARYPYNKMEFYKCTYYLKIAGCFDRFYDKLKEMIKEKKEELGENKIYPAKPKRGKYPSKLNTIHILHIGDEWNTRTLTDPESKGRSIEIARKCGPVYYNKAEMKEVKRTGDLPPRPAKVGNRVVSQLVHVTLKDENTKEEIEMDRVEMTVISLPTPMSGRFWDWNYVNWFHLIYLVNRYRAVIHTDNPQYLIAINMIMATWNILLNRNWQKNCDNENLLELGEGMYKRYRELYNPESDPIDSWLMWVNAMTSLYVALIPKADAYTEKEEYLFRFNIDLFGRDDPWKMDQRRAERVKQQATVIHWHKEQEIPLDEETPFTEKIKLQLEEPRADFKWGKDEYFTEKPDDDVEELLAKNPDGGRVTIPKAPKRHSMDIRIKKKQKLDEEEGKVAKKKKKVDGETDISSTGREKSQPAETDRTSKKEAESERPGDKPSDVEKKNSSHSQ